VDFRAGCVGAGSIFGFLGQPLFGFEQLENRRAHRLGLGFGGYQDLGALRHHDHGVHLGKSCF
jgi:hypothetical protein